MSNIIRSFTGYLQAEPM